MALDLAERRAHRGRHRAEAGLAARFGIHRVDFSDQPRALGCEILGLDSFRERDLRKQPEEDAAYFARLFFSISA
jgi:hypothetical protein